MVISVTMQNWNLPANQHSGQIMAKQTNVYTDFTAENPLKFSNMLWLTPCSGVWFEKPTIAIEIPFFYGTRMFITLFTKARYWSLSWASWIHATTSYPIPLRFKVQYGTVPLKLPVGIHWDRNKYQKSRTFNAMKIVNGWTKRKFIDKKSEMK
jgi:hypothetical protein